MKDKGQADKILEFQLEFQGVPLKETAFHHRERLPCKDFEFDISDLHLPSKNEDHLGLPHRNDYYQIVLITQGDGHCTIDLVTHSYHKGSLIIVSKNQIQVFHCSSKTRGYIISFHMNFLYKYETDQELLFDMQIFNYHISSPIIDLNPKDYQGLKNLINITKTEFNLPDHRHKEEMIRSHLRILIILIERKKLGLFPKKEISPDQRILIRLRDLLEEGFVHSRYIQYYCEKLSISYWKLNQLSKKYIGMTIKELINYRVILEIKRLLTHSDMNITEIAYSLGFDDPSNLTKFFNNYTGKSPSEFRVSS